MVQNGGDLANCGRAGSGRVWRGRARPGKGTYGAILIGQ